MTLENNDVGGKIREDPPCTDPVKARIQALEKIGLIIHKAFIWVAGILLVIMAFLTSANIVSRMVWVPIGGTFELMGYFGAVMTAFALGYTQLQRGHVAVDVLVHRFSKRTQRIIEAINCFVLMVFFSLVAWQIVRYGMTLLKTGEITETLRIVYYPFTFAVALGCAVLVLAFLTQFLQTLFQAKGVEG